MRQSSCSAGVFQCLLEVEHFTVKLYVSLSVENGNAEVSAWHHGSDKAGKLPSQLTCSTNSFCGRQFENGPGNYHDLKILKSLKIKNSLDIYSL